MPRFRAVDFVRHPLSLTLTRARKSSRFALFVGIPRPVFARRFEMVHASRTASRTEK